MIDKIQGAGQINRNAANSQVGKNGAANGDFGAMLQRQIDFSKHAMERAEQRGIELTPGLMDKLADSVEKAQGKGATNILAFDDSRAFIINVPHGRVITTMSGEEMKENIFTNIDGAVLL